MDRETGREVIVHLAMWTAHMTDMLAQIQDRLSPAEYAKLRRQIAGIIADIAVDIINPI